jgi:hypothetical protein
LLTKSRKNLERGIKDCVQFADLDIIEACQRSSVVEQRFRKPPVVSSTLTAGSNHSKNLSGSYLTQLIP